MLVGFAPPYTTPRRSALLPTLPWRHAGVALSVADESADRAAAAPPAAVVRIVATVMRNPGEAGPCLGLLGTSTLLDERPSPGRPRPVDARSSGLALGPLAPGVAELRLFDGARDERGLLAPRGPGRASLGEMPLAVEGAIAEDDA